MLILKLVKGLTVRIVEATEIQIDPAGNPEGPQINQAYRSSRVRAIEVKTWAGSKQVFYVSPDALDVHGILGVHENWDIAYVENAHGATTQIVRGE